MRTIVMSIAGGPQSFESLAKPNSPELAAYGEHQENSPNNHGERAVFIKLQASKLGYQDSGGQGGDRTPDQQCVRLPLYH
jgi:hypothetical protein